MQLKTATFTILAVVLGGTVLFMVVREQSDREIVDQLARRQSQVPAGVEAGPTGDPYQPEFFQLTNSLIAEQGRGPANWVIRGGREQSFVEIPFLPTIDGVLPQPSVDDTAKLASPTNNPGFLGADVCAECHRDKHQGFVHTAHHQTSGPVDPETMRGPFTPPRNTLRTRDEKLFFTMLRRDDRFYQQVSFADWKLEFPLDVFTGSAKAGRTFLYWNDDALYQAFVSYLSATDEWIASPGYAQTEADYTRRIRSACLECHVTYIDLKRGSNVYDRESAVWGISCERCHGPGREHVVFHRDRPQEKMARHIVHPADLPRDRQLGICGQCHSGSFSLLGEAFTYRPGDDLDKYHKLFNPEFAGVGGIHTSNQLTRLGMSKCFQASEMTCTSCHNPHQNQRGKREIFTASCLRCHQPTHCGMSAQLGEKVAENCIDCHMPMGENEGMTLQVSQGTFTVKMIDHYIRIDKDATEAYLSN